MIFFYAMHEDFECLTTSIRGSDVVNHIRYFQPDAFVYCITPESRETINKLITALDTIERKKLNLILIGDSDTCEEFTLMKPELVSLTLLKPITASASKQIGAMELSEKAAHMEKAGNEQDALLIHQCTDELLEQYLRYLEILKPYFPEEHAENIAQKEMVESDLRGYFDNIRTAAEELDFDAMEYVLEVMSEYKYEGMHAEWFAQMKDAVSEYDVDRCEEVLQEWEDAL